MKKKFGFLSAFLTLWMSFSTAFAADTIPTITNGEVPTGTRYTLVLHENLRLGAEQGDAFLWTQVGTAVKVDDQGTMYVTGAGENRVTVINAKGEFMRHIGAPGQGPGEYQGLTSFQVLADGRGVAFETMGVASSLSWYDNKLGFVEKANLGKSGNLFQSALLSPNGRFVYSQVVGVDPSAGKMNMSWVILDREGDSKNVVAQFDNPMPSPDIVKSPDNFAKFMGQMLTSEAQGLIGFATFDRDNNVYTATAKHYEITRWDSQMNRQLVISRKHKPIPLTEEDINAVVTPIADVMQSKMPPQMSHLFAESTVRKAVEIAEFPPVKHPISGLAVLEDGTLCVIHEVDLVEQKMTLDLFNKKGEYLGDFTYAAPGMNSWVLEFQNGHLYRIEANEDEEYEVVRYAYKLVPADPK